MVDSKTIKHQDMTFREFLSNNVASINIFSEVFLSKRKIAVNATKYCEYCCVEAN